MACPRLRFGALIVLLALVAGACAWQAPDLILTGPAVAESTKIFAADGTLITTLHADQNRETVPLSQMPKQLQQAVVAIEDERFWHHTGVDIRAMVRAAWADATHGKVVQGGSTITEQYVKNVLADRERTVHRKLREAALAYQLEHKIGKSKILAGYLNTIYFGNGAYGVQAASETYFGEPAEKLTLPQAALLAGLIRSPNNYDPYDHADAASARRIAVLDKMASLHDITDEQAAAAKATPLGVGHHQPSGSYPAPYFVEAVKQQILDDPEFGGGQSPAQRQQNLFNGGLRIYTTVDLAKQAEAEQAIAKVLSQPATDPSAAVVSLEPGTGNVRALVGGRDFFGGGSQAKFNLATQGQRPAGSSFKPFVLAAAVQEGVSLHKLYAAPQSLDLPLPRGGVWHVRNFEDEGGGTMDLVEATVHSINTVYARLILEVGPNEALDVARRLGITSHLDPYPSAVLGTNDVTPLEMASAYGAIDNKGAAVTPSLISRVTKADGTVLYQHQPDPRPALAPNVVDQVRSVLEQVVQRGTGVNARIGRPAAGKTGTGEQWRDAWFVGFTPELVTSVWVGFADAQRSMVPPATRITVQGGTWPAQIWQLYMSAALAQTPVSPFPPATPAASADNGTMRPVPNVSGMPVDVAEDQLGSEGFTAHRVSVANGDYPPGFVVGQSPCAGCLAPGGSAITLQVGTGNAPAHVPNVLGLSESEARDTLRSAGFAPHVVTQQEPPAADAASRAGLVWKQSPAAGSAATQGTTVTVWVDPVGIVQAVPPPGETTTTG
ncbi:MAG: PBP1A family penicillin-binding protein [Acidimicrobiia bacterium]|nr:PBP1A family penicillin-binding protein [Acidimicrobiia bacterium]